MAAGDLITTDWQAEYRGVLIGAGTSFRIKSIDGLDLPPVRSSDFSFTRAHGEVPRSLDYLSGRDVTLTLSINTSTAATFQDAQRSFETLVAPVGDGVDEPLVIKLAGRDAIRINCVPRRYTKPININYSFARVASCIVQFHAHDPLVYANAADTSNTTREVPGAGVELPITLPITFPSSTSGTLTITNDGTVTAPWTGRLDGPLEQPVITHLETGRSLALTANGGIDLLSGQWIDIDSSASSILMNGTSDRSSVLSIDSRWWGLAVGANTFKLAADSGAGTLTVTARDAWLS